ncbi:efflux RND transporter periplasmic adaptor subunit [Bartonella tamiae]|uniref:Efflux transporter, RND family, MFP subunit n=1 Tax=Bartonella tamiae Th239 TaxID=1094558 RepID=J0R122_9HYPH|nr:efflux RND transporter periplasmic adaptor subunit [Bartonella tamiae]EJF89244.1 efflux transporter, RND family, MFP subunit [Bartonella tamiae Th239]EJF95352.1 efflux transporter, RND family, MFP subunit [Bartonella tamiae Th307]
MQLLKKAIPFILLVVLLFSAYQWISWKRDQPIKEIGQKVVQSDSSPISSEPIPVSASLVVVKPVDTKFINDRLSAIGTGVAVSTVHLTPWSSGLMDEIFVVAGDKVKQDEPVAKLDSDTEEVAVERSKVMVHDAELALARTMKLRATNTATEVQQLTAQLELDNAKLALREAEIALDRRTIRAPINGVVGIFTVDAGNYVTSETTIARIDNREQILVDIWVPERFAPLINIGDKIKASSIARPGEDYQGHISAIDNMIDEKSRTLRVRAEVDNQNDVLRSGMSFAVSLQFPGDPFSAVDPLAIQWSGEGSYVWRVVDHHVQRVAVSIVQRETNYVLVQGALSQGDQVVIQGLQNIRQGSSVIIANKDQNVDTVMNDRSDKKTLDLIEQ